MCCYFVWHHKTIENELFCVVCIFWLYELEKELLKTLINSLKSAKKQDNAHKMQSIINASISLLSHYYLIFFPFWLILQSNTNTVMKESLIYACPSLTKGSNFQRMTSRLMPDELESQTCIPVFCLTWAMQSHWTEKAASLVCDPQERSHYYDSSWNCDYLDAQSRKVAFDNHKRCEMFFSFHHRCQTIHPSLDRSQSEANRRSRCCDIMVWDMGLKWLTSYWYTQDMNYVAVSTSGFFYLDSQTHNCDLFTDVSGLREERSLCVCYLSLKKRRNPNATSLKTDSSTKMTVKM